MLTKKYLHSAYFWETLLTMHVSPQTDRVTAQEFEKTVSLFSDRCRSACFSIFQ